MKFILQIRQATIDDISSIVEIYNQAIRSRSATGDMQEFKVEDRVEWFNNFDADNFPVYVAVVDRKIVGYATLSQYRQGREAMNKVAEISFYVDYSFHKKGIGSSLIKYILDDSKRIKKEHLLAILLDRNIDSIKLLEKFNFKAWGHLPDIIDFGESRCGHLIYGINLLNRK